MRRTLQEKTRMDGIEALIIKSTQQRNTTEKTPSHGKKQAVSELLYVSVL